MKNSILINNFHSPSGGMVVYSEEDKNKKQTYKTYMYGFEDNKAKKEKREKVIQSLLSSLLIHDDIYLTFQDFRQVVDYIGPEDTFLLLSLKCLKIITDQFTNPVILVEKDRLSLNTLSRIGDEVEKFESSLKDLTFSSETQKQKFILCTEDSLIKCDDNRLRQLIRQEVSSDLKNINIREELHINSQSTKDVSKYDISDIIVNDIFSQFKSCIYSRQRWPLGELRKYENRACTPCDPSTWVTYCLSGDKTLLLPSGVFCPLSNPKVQ